MKIQVTGTKVLQIAVDEVRTVELDDAPKVIFVKSGTNAGIITVDAGATVATEAGAVFSAALTTASKINVDITSNKVVIENKTAGIVDVDYYWI